MEDLSCLLNSLNSISQTLQKKQNDNFEYIQTSLKTHFPDIDENKLLEIYKVSISLRQANVQKSGSHLENTICEHLKKNEISYRTQVTIDKNGVIIGFHMKKTCSHIIDIVIGDNIEIGKSVKDFIVVSCKTTCRERWTQDEWTLSFPPKKYILVTCSSDYPSSMRFQESSIRMICTCKPKKKDDRIYKVSFDDLLDEVI